MRWCTMADQIKFAPNEKGFIEVRNWPSTQQLLLGKAQAIAAEAQSKSYRGAEYTCDVRPGKKRAHAQVKTANASAYWSERKHHALTSSIDAGR